MRREQITIYLDQPEADAVRARAKRHGTSIGEAARDIVAAGLRALADEAERVAAQNEAMG